MGKSRANLNFVGISASEGLAAGASPLPDEYIRPLPEGEVERLPGEVEQQEQALSRMSTSDLSQRAR